MIKESDIRLLEEIMLTLEQLKLKTNDFPDKNLSRIIQHAIDKMDKMKKQETKGIGLVEKLLGRLLHLLLKLE